MAGLTKPLQILNAPRVAAGGQIDAMMDVRGDLTARIAERMLEQEAIAGALPPARAVDLAAGALNAALALTGVTLTAPAVLSGIRARGVSAKPDGH